MLCERDHAQPQQQEPQVKTCIISVCVWSLYFCLLCKITLLLSVWVWVWVCACVRVFLVLLSLWGPEVGTFRQSTEGKRLC